VVQRIQRYAQSSVFKRSVLQGIAQELLDSSPEGGAFQRVACPVDRSGLDRDVSSRPVLAAPCNSPLNAILALLHVDCKEQVRREQLLLVLHGGAAAAGVAAAGAAGGGQACMLLCRAEARRRPAAGCSGGSKQRCQA
jgi:hypothetical protein